MQTREPPGGKPEGLHYELLKKRRWIVTPGRLLGKLGSDANSSKLIGVQTLNSASP